MVLAVGEAQTIRVRPRDAVGCLTSRLLVGRLICSALEVDGRHLKARGLRSIAAFACIQTTVPVLLPHDHRELSSSGQLQGPTASS